MVALGWTQLREANRKWYGTTPDGVRSSLGAWFEEVDNLGLLGLKRADQLIKERGLPLGGLFFETMMTLNVVTTTFEIDSTNSSDTWQFSSSSSMGVPGAETAATARAIINMIKELTE